MRHFVTLIEIWMHLIRVNPGHIWNLSALCPRVRHNLKHPRQEGDWRYHPTILKKRMPMIVQKEEQ